MGIDWVQWDRDVAALARSMATIRAWVEATPVEDGSVECGACRTKLNETDKNCWRCGSTNLMPVLAPGGPQPILTQADPLIG